MSRLTHPVIPLPDNVFGALIGGLIVGLACAAALWLVTWITGGTVDLAGLLLAATFGLVASLAIYAILSQRKRRLRKRR